MTTGQIKILRKHAGQQVTVFNDFTGRAVGVRGILWGIRENKRLAGFQVFQDGTRVAAHVNVSDIITLREQNPDIHDGDTLFVYVKHTFQKPGMDARIRRFVG